MFPTAGEEKENRTRVGFHGSIKADAQVSADRASQVVHFPAHPNTPAGPGAAAAEISCQQSICSGRQKDPSPRTKKKPRILPKRWKPSKQHTCKTCKDSWRFGISNSPKHSFLLFFKQISLVPQRNREEMGKLLEKLAVKNLYWINIIHVFHLLMIEADFFGCFEIFVNKTYQACFTNDISICSWIKIISLMQKWI